MQRIEILNGVPFDIISREKLLESIIDFASQRKKKLVLNMNAYGVLTYLENKNYARIINSADIIYPDGWGPVIASWLTKGDKLKERINVGDFIYDLLDQINKKSLSIYLLGCEQSVAKLATQQIKRYYSNIKITGYFHGFFNEKEEKIVLKKIMKTSPHLIFVGLGVPEQEMWIKKHWDRLPNAVHMGIGGVFHYIAKTKSRAPFWMRNFGLEWLYRLIQEPERLWRRYTVINVKFVYYLFKALL